ncbi:hypothetical protein [Mesonia sp.]|uniref:hypothetical protein n=1 Tax=Mesonia sp. TaxID=1960830 RepID=UPI0025BD0673|nr:hypothetical protein [Mesonia sp.]
MLLILLFLTGCVSTEREMMPIEKSLAKKYKAESFQLNFLTVSKKSFGNTKEKRKLLSVSIKNPKDIEKIFLDNSYSEKYSTTIANYIVDSLGFERLPFQPQELQIDFFYESGFSLLSNESKKSYSFQLFK